MSDYRSDQGATQVMPPIPPAPPGTAAPAGGDDRRRGAAWWLVAIIALLAALLAGGGAYLLARGGAAKFEADVAEMSTQNAGLKAQVDDLTSRLTSATAALDAARAAAEAATTPPVAASTPATSTAAEEPPATTTPPASTKTVRQFTLIKKITWSTSAGYQLVADYEQLLTGAAAEAAAAAHGDTIEGESFYIVNDNPKLRTFTLANDADIRVLNWAGKTGTNATKIPVGQFMDVMPGGTNPQNPWKTAHYYVTVKGGTTVIKVEHVYFP